jgi:tetratricopeptide (TPR) repeat protein
MLLRLLSKRLRRGADARTALPPWVDELLRAWQARDIQPPYPLALLHARPGRARLAAALANGEPWEEAHFWIEEARRQSGKAGEEAVDLLLQAELCLAHGRDVAAAEAALEELHAGDGAVAMRAGVLLSWRLWLRGEMARLRAIARRLAAGAPDSPASRVLIGISDEMEGRPEAALQSFRQAHQAAPDSAQTIGLLAQALLLRRQWREGFEMFGRIPGPHADYVDAQACPVWRGEPLAGKRLLAVATLLFGDQMQLMRFVREVRAAHPGVHVATTLPPALTRLVAGSGLFDEIVPADVPRERFDAQIGYHELPVALGLAAQAPVWHGPYLRVASEEIAQAAAWLPAVPQAAMQPSLQPGLQPALQPASQPALQPGVRRVGLRWYGSGSEINGIRSMPLAELRPLFDVPGIEWVALAEEPAALRAAAGTPLLDVSAHLRDFAATAALMHQLDLVLTVDTSVAHLAGALGRPAWVMTRPDPEWRWGIGTPETPWYPDLRLFRHPPGGFDRAAVIRDVARALAQWCAQAQTAAQA